MHNTVAVFSLKPELQYKKLDSNLFSVVEKIEDLHTDRHNGRKQKLPFLSRLKISYASLSSIFSS